MVSEKQTPVMVIRNRWVTKVVMNRYKDDGFNSAGCQAMVWKQLTLRKKVYHTTHTHGRRSLRVHHCSLGLKFGPSSAQTHAHSTGLDTSWTSFYDLYAL